MYEKIKAYVKQHHMLSTTDRVIVGVSGGADSICLLFMLAKMKEEMGFSVTAVHVHHGLRGESADRDEKYVKEICESIDIELLVYHEDVRKYAKEYGYTEEEAGRELRRKIFESVLAEKKATKIALAHHKNDNVETVLWNMCRGTGLKGLGGICPVNSVYIRPLLCVKRKEIQKYLEENQIAYCIDETNLENNYTRNRIRNQVIPYLEESVNHQTVTHMADMIEYMRLLNEYVEAETIEWKKECISRREYDYILKKEVYEKVPAVFQKNIIYEFLAMAAGKKKDIEAAHVILIEGLLEKQVGRKCSLPYGLEAHRIYEGISLVKKDEKVSFESENKEIPVHKIKVFERNTEMVTFPENPYTKWFDYDIISNTLEIRHRKPGDYIVINKEGKTQKIKQYFINEKIPQNIRDQIWLVADGQEIVWIVGYRQSKKYQITNDTVKIMEISFEEI